MEKLFKQVGAGQYVDRSESPTIILEVVANYDIYMTHIFWFTRI